MRKQGSKLCAGNLSCSLTNDEWEDLATKCYLGQRASPVREDEMVPRTEETL
jgi:hypothetical protein